MDSERALLTKAIATGQIEKIINAGIEEHHFASPDVQELWRTTVAHVRKYRIPPSSETVKKQHPDFGWQVTGDSLDFLIDEFTKTAKRRAAITGFRELAKAIDDPERLPQLEEEVLELGRSLSQLFPGSDVAKFSDMKKRIAKYDELAKDGNILGIPMGVKPFDELTFGIQPHEYISVVGWQGTGKSTLLQHMFFQAYLAGHTPLMVSLEMDHEALFRKWDTMAINFRYRALKAMELGKGDRAKWEAMAERAESAANNIIVLDKVARCTVDKVYAIANQYAPSLIGIDYVSLMDTPRGVSSEIWQKVTYLTQGLKQISRGLKIPIIALAQTNIGSADEGAKLENIAYSRSIGQDSDIVIGLYQDKDGKMKARKQMEVRMLKNRDGPTTSATMYWDLDHMVIREWKAADMFGVNDNYEENDNGSE